MFKREYDISELKKIADMTGKINEPEKFKPLLDAYFKDMKDESVVAFLLNGQCELISFFIAHIGTLDACQFDNRTILREALINNASKIVIAHNHPSGCKDFSREDIGITKKFGEACNIVGIKILDHLLYANGCVISGRNEICGVNWG